MLSPLYEEMTASIKVLDLEQIYATINPMKPLPIFFVSNIMIFGTAVLSGKSGPFERARVIGYDSHSCGAGRAVRCFVPQRKDANVGRNFHDS